MEKGEVFKDALIDAMATAAYVVIVALFIYFGGQGWFGNNSNVLIPIVMLMLLVFSAALTGFLVFGKPVMWYLGGKKREAISLLSYTLIIFLILTLVALAILALVNI